MRTEPTRQRALSVSPVDPAQAAKAIEGAADREQIFGLLLRAARSHAPFVALLSVHKEVLCGRRALADDRFVAGDIDDLRIPRQTVPAFEEAIASRFPYVGAIATRDPAVDELLRQLGGVVPPSAMVLPVVLGERTVALLVGHRGEDELSHDEVAGLFPLVTESGRVLARVLAPRAEAAAQKPGKRAATSAGEVPVDDVVEQRRVLEVYRQYESWEELADAIRALIRMGVERGEPDEDEQLELLVELGAIEADHLGRNDLAIEAWRSAQTIDAGDGRVIERLEAIFAAEERWSDFVELIERRAAITDDQQERIGLLLNAAAFAIDRLDDADRAVHAYERILGWQPMHQAAAEKLEALYRAREQWQPLAAMLLEQASKNEDTKAAVAALESVAEMVEERLGDARAAFLVWLAVMRREPDRADLVDVLERLGPAADAWEELVPECATLAAETEKTSPGLAARLYRLVGRWTRAHLGNQDAAVAALERALALEPDDAGAVDELVELKRAGAAWIDVAAGLARRADLELDPLRRAELHVELGQLYERELAQTAEAVVAYERAVADDPRSQPALAALRRLHRERRDWDSLARVLHQTIETLEGRERPEDVVAIHVELGGALAELGRHEEAGIAFQNALDLDGRSEAAFEGLRAVQRAAGQDEAYLATFEAQLDALATPEQAPRYGDLALEWDGRGRRDRALACWQKLVAAQRARIAGLAGAERAAGLLVIAAVCGTRLEDTAGAIVAAEEALSLEPESLPVLNALAPLYERAGRWREALTTLETLAGRAAEPTARADLMNRIGRIHAARKDPTRAQSSFEGAIALDPAHAAAREGLADAYEGQGEWEKAAHQLVNAARSYERPADAIRSLVRAAGLYRERLNDRERARACLERVVGLEPDHVDAKRGLSELLVGEGEWQASWPHLQELVQKVRAEASAPAAERFDVYARASRCAAELDDAASALDLFEHALAAAQEMGPSAASFAQLAEIQARLGRRPQAIAFYERVHELDPTQPSIVEKIGDLERPDSPAQAASRYRRAVDLDARNHRVLQKLLDAQSEIGQWEDAVQTIGRFIVLERDTAKRGKYFLAMAAIQREELEDEDSALDSYERALDAFLSGGPNLDAAGRTRALEAFRGMDEILTAEKDWGRQERAYRGLIKRLPAGDPLLVTLWHALGEIHRTRLGKLDHAIAAFETAHSLDPEKRPERVQILTELYRLVGKEAPGKVKDAAAKLIESDPGNPEPYRALGKACLDAGKLDEAWCVCRALVFLKKATAEEDALYRKHEPMERRKPKGVLDDDSWTFVRDDAEDRVITSIFALVWEAPVALRAGPAKSFQLDPKDELKIENNQRVMAKIFQASSRVLAAPLPHVYVQGERSGRLLLANCVEGGRLQPTIIVGRDLMAGYRDTEIVFAVASTVALLRPAYYLRLALPTLDELEAALWAAVALCRPDVQVRRELAHLVQAYGTEMAKRIAPHSADLLRDLVGRLPERPDVTRWMNAVDTAARRAGLLVCGELAAAAKMASTEAALPGGARPSDKVRDLLVYSVSPAYFAARRHLGVTVV